MNLSLDFGGSTIDMILWQKEKPIDIWSFERYPRLVKADLGTILKKVEKDRLFSFSEIEKIFITGGRSSFLKKSFFKGIKIVRIPEIEAIGRGGAWLISRNLNALKKIISSGKNQFLVVSMGTGTCMVKVQLKNGKYYDSTHVGGTGVGGGTFLGLSKSLLKIDDIEILKKMFNKGKKNKVDLSVKDVIGSGIGLVPGSATASNLAKISREINFSKEDLAAGIVNLIGQTIGITSVFAAKANKINLVVLTGKLILLNEIVDIIKETAKIYNIGIIVPKQAEYVSAFGAGSTFRF